MLRIPRETARCGVPCVPDGCESQVYPGAGVVPLRAAPPCRPFHVKQQRALLLSQMLMGNQEDPLPGDVSTRTAVQAHIYAKQKPAVLLMARPTEARESRCALGELSVNCRTANCFT